MFFSIIYNQAGLLWEEDLYAPSMFEAFYFSAMIFTSNGYADFTPTSEVHDVVIVEAIFGYLMVPLLISAAINILEQSSLHNKNRYE